ncbi:WD40 repeat-like protein [Microthyrium microscopicum]|uniref:WD40 repeat-like protein n=1 Tax=Microthyrium microscopicum TaxID=703497 RepID=A0A6A6UUP3_9PEZI|nr:WD40 repeat-like protein [Microthyrium microscopicum]
MAAQVVRLAPVRKPAAPEPLTADQRYWKAFSSQQLLPAPNSSPITHVSTNSTPILASQFQSSSLAAPTSYIAVTTGPRLQLISPQTLKPLRTIARTSSPFHSATVRRDGRIILAGSESGTIQAFDTTSRAILKTWNEHKQAVWVTQWHPRDLTSCMSASDDATVRLWDLPSETSTWTGFGHTDYVRTGAFIGGTNLVATGSYDQSIRLWDARIGSSESSSRAVMHFALSSPVEAVLPLPGGTTLVGAAGPSLAVLDLVAARPLHLLQNHQKTITSLTLASQGSRVLTGGLDGHVKVFDTASWTVVAGFKYPSPVLSLCMTGAGEAKDDRHLCVGLQSGLLSIRSRLSPTAKAAAAAREAALSALAGGDSETFDKITKKANKKKRKLKEGAGWEMRIRGKTYKGEGADIIIAPGHRAKHTKLAAWEHSMRQGTYARALDEVLATRDTSAILTVLQALTHRSAIRTSLQGRNTVTLTPLMRFLLKNLDQPMHVQLLTDVAGQVLDIYGEHLGKNEEFDQMVESLHNVVRRGCEVAQMCYSSVGMMELLQAGAG